MNIKEIKKRYNINIGENIKKYRKLNKMTQLELAKKLEKTVITIKRYEYGQITVPDHVLVDISKILGITTDLLIENKGILETQKYNVIENLLNLMGYSFKEEEKYIGPELNWEYDSPNSSDFEPFFTIKNKFIEKNLSVEELEEFFKEIQKHIQFLIQDLPDKK